MARTRYKVHQKTHPHFMTCTVINWIPVFTRRETAQFILDSLQFLQDQGRLILYGYVILENHCHLIAKAKENLSIEMMSFKSYTAKQIISHLDEKKVKRLLDQMKFYKARHKTDREYQVWEDGYHPQLIQNDDMMRQKLEYIHDNPVKRGYVDRPEHWRYSSARNYLGMEGLIEVTTHW